jgi:hypothetical protein
MFAQSFQWFLDPMRPKNLHLYGAEPAVCKRRALGRGPFAAARSRIFFTAAADAAFAAVG